MRLLLLVVFAWFGTVQLAFAASATVRYSAEVLEECRLQLDRTDIEFPNYTGEALSVHAPVRVGCMPGINYTVTLSPGQTLSGNPSQGRLLTHTENENATLMFNAQLGVSEFSEVWSSGMNNQFIGEGQGIDSFGEAFNPTFRIPAGQTGRPAGRYEAELTVSVNF